MTFGLRGTKVPPRPQTPPGEVEGRIFSASCCQFFEDLWMLVPVAKHDMEGGIPGRTPNSTIVSEI